VHLRHDIVMEHVTGFLEERVTVDVQRRGPELEPVVCVVPRGTVRVP
jgi:hypothetical protein